MTKDLAHFAQGDSLAVPAFAPVAPTQGVTGPELYLTWTAGPFAGTTVPCHGMRWLVGADNRCSIECPAVGVAPVQFSISQTTQGYVVRSWDPSTRLNGQMFEECPLSHGDRLAFGTAALTVSFAVPGEPPAGEYLPAAAQPGFTDSNTSRAVPQQRPGTVVPARDALATANVQALQPRMGEPRRNRARVRKLVAALRAARNQARQEHLEFERQQQQWLANRSKQDEVVERLQQSEQLAARLREEWLRCQADLQKTESRLHLYQGQSADLQQQLAKTNVDLDVLRQEGIRLASLVCALQETRSLMRQELDHVRAEMAGKAASLEETLSQERQRADANAKRLEEFGSYYHRRAQDQDARESSLLALEAELAARDQEAQRKEQAMREALERLSAGEAAIRAREAELERLFQQPEMPAAEQIPQTQVELESLRLEVLVATDRVRALEAQLKAAVEEANRQTVWAEEQQAIAARQSALAAQLPACDAQTQPSEPAADHSAELQSLRQQLSSLHEQQLQFQAAEVRSQTEFRQLEEQSAQQQSLIAQLQLQLEETNASAGEKDAAIATLEANLQLAAADASGQGSNANLQRQLEELALQMENLQAECDARQRKESGLQQELARLRLDVRTRDQELAQVHEQLALVQGREYTPRALARNAEPPRPAPQTPKQDESQAFPLPSVTDRPPQYSDEQFNALFRADDTAIDGEPISAGDFSAAPFEDPAAELPSALGHETIDDELASIQSLIESQTHPKTGLNESEAAFKPEGALPSSDLEEGEYRDEAKAALALDARRLLSGTEDGDAQTGADSPELKAIDRSLDEALDDVSEKTAMASTARRLFRPKDEIEDDEFNQPTQFVDRAEAADRISNAVASQGQHSSEDNEGDDQHSEGLSPRSWSGEPPAVPFEEGEESIEDYMARLLQRLRPDDVASTSRKTVTKTLTKTPTSEPTRAQPAPAPTPTFKKASSLDEVYTKRTPTERLTNIDSMRELANSQARAAIAKHAWERVLFQRLCYLSAAIIGAVLFLCFGTWSFFSWGINQVIIVLLAIASAVGSYYSYKIYKQFEKEIERQAKPAALAETTMPQQEAPKVGIVGYGVPSEGSMLKETDTAWTTQITQGNPLGTPPAATWPGTNPEGTHPGVVTLDSNPVFDQAAYHSNGG